MLPNGTLKSLIHHFLYDNGQSTTEQIFNYVSKRIEHIKRENLSSCLWYYNGKTIENTGRGIWNLMKDKKEHRLEKLIYELAKLQLYYEEILMDKNVKFDERLADFSLNDEQKELLIEVIKNHVNNK